MTNKNEITPYAIQLLEKGMSSRKVIDEINLDRTEAFEGLMVCLSVGNLMLHVYLGFYYNWGFLWSLVSFLVLFVAYGQALGSMERKRQYKIEQLVSSLPEEVKDRVLKLIEINDARDKVLRAYADNPQLFITTHLGNYTPELHRAINLRCELEGENYLISLSQSSNKLKAA